MDPNQQNQNQSATEFSDAPAEPAAPEQNALLDSPESANGGDLAPAENPTPANGSDSTPALAENFASVIDGEHASDSAVAENFATTSPSDQISQNYAPATPTTNTFSAANPTPESADSTASQNSMFAATPTTPITNSGQNPNSAPAKKSHKKLIIALAAGIGGFLLIGAAIFLIVNNNKIHNLAEFKFAMKNHKAINCQYVIDDGMFRPEHMLLQTNDGWSRAHAKLSGGFTVEAWYVANGAKMTAYTTLSNGGKSASIKQDGKMSDLEDSVSPNDDDMGAIKDLKCDANYKADFAVPNRDWKPENDAKLTIDSDKSDDSNSDDGSDDDAAADGARQHDAEKIRGALLAYATDNIGAWPTNECLTTDFSLQGESSCFGSYVGLPDEITKIVPGDKSLAVGNTAAIQLGADCKGTPDAESAAVYVAQEIYEPRSPYCLDSTSGADYLH